MAVGYKKLNLGYRGGCMGTALDEQLSMRFASAEAAGSCLVPLDKTERRAVFAFCASRLSR